MKPKIKADFVKALRSGDYHPGKYGVLRAYNRDTKRVEHNPSGVLCELFAKAHPDLEFWSDSKDLSGATVARVHPEDDPAIKNTPGKVDHWAGIYADEESAILDTYAYMLRNPETKDLLMDGVVEVPIFESLANWIEKNVE